MSPSLVLVLILAALGTRANHVPSLLWPFKLISPTKAIAGVLVLLAITVAAAGETIALKPLPLPGGERGIGFDDMGFAPSIHKVIVPAGRSGNLDLIDPETKQVTAIGGFSSRASFRGGHGQGVTSADEGAGLLFATDRDAKRLDVVNPKTQSVVGTAFLASGPDYVRYVSTTGEVWVTQPSASRIEVFSSPAKGARIPYILHSSPFQAVRSH